jgi:transposase-like protein
MKSSRWCWHLDEMFVKINGERHYLWRAVDQVLPDGFEPVSPRAV